ncbi:hypothetical protein F5D26_27280 [Burkholderia pseudomallei]|nr:hypothetical protein F5D26_27280 [Burkholderia pseudomallei]
MCGETRYARPCRPGSARLPDGRTDFRLPGCPAARLPGCPAARLPGCPAERPPERLIVRRSAPRRLWRESRRAPRATARCPPPLVARRAVSRAARRRRRSAARRPATRGCSTASCARSPRAPRA